MSSFYQLSAEFYTGDIHHILIKKCIQYVAYNELSKRHDLFPTNLKQHFVPQTNSHEGGHIRMKRKGLIFCTVLTNIVIEINWGNRPLRSPSITCLLLYIIHLWLFFECHFLSTKTVLSKDAQPLRDTYL